MIEALIQRFKKNLPVILLTILALALRLYRLEVQSFWFDEAYTMLIARMPYKDAWQAIVADGVHPPFFYFLQRALLWIGESEPVFRLGAVIFGTLAIPVFHMLCKCWAGRNVAFIGGLLLALSPFHIWYSQEARMYALLMTLAVASMLSFERIMAGEGAKWYVLLVVFSAIAYLTHYFALLLPLTQFVFLAFNLRKYSRAFRKWTISQVLAGLPLLIWIIVLAQRPEQFFGIGWIPMPQARDLIYTLINFSVGFTKPITVLQWAGLSIALILAVLGLRNDWQWSDGRMLAAIWAFFPICLIFLISLSRPTYIDRFFIGSLPAYLLLIASGISSLGRWRTIFVAFAICALLMTGISRFSFGATQQKEEWRKAGSTLNRAQFDEAIVTRILQSVVPLLYYYDGPIELKAMEINREVTPIAELAAGNSGMWLVYWNVMNNAHLVTSDQHFDAASETDPVLNEWIRGDGPTIMEKLDFRGVTIFHFRFSP